MAERNIAGDGQAQARPAGLLAPEKLVEDARLDGVRNARATVHHPDLDLAGAQASKTGEWRGGIGRLADAAPWSVAVRGWLEVVRGFNEAGAITVYPGWENGRMASTGASATTRCHSSIG